MIKPGVYKHYKSTAAEPKLYRVLFVAKWENGGAPVADEELDVYAIGSEQEPKLCVSCQTSDPLDPDVLIVHAKWSGNSSEVTDGSDIVIYVALYGEGRVAARRLDEFEQRTGGDIDVARFEWVGP